MKYLRSNNFGTIGTNDTEIIASASSWTIDADSNVAMPVNYTEYQAWINGNSWTVAPPVPTALWLCQEASGNLADTLGTRTAVKTGNSSYQVDVGGWATNGYKLADNDFSSWFAWTTGITSSDAAALFGIVKLNSQSVVQSLFSIGGIADSNCLEVRTDASGQVIAKVKDQVATGTISYVGHVMGVLAVYRPTANTFRVYTKEKGFSMDTIAPAWAGVPSINGTAGYLSSGWFNSSNATVMRVEFWTGTAVENDFNATFVSEFFSRRGF